MPGDSSAIEAWSSVVGLLSGSLLTCYRPEAPRPDMSFSLTNSSSVFTYSYQSIWGQSYRADLLTLLTLQ